MASTIQKEDLCFKNNRTRAYSWYNGRFFSKNYVLRRRLIPTLQVEAPLLRDQGATYAQMLEEHDYTGTGFPMDRCDLPAVRRLSDYLVPCDLDSKISIFPIAQDSLTEHSRSKAQLEHHLLHIRQSRPYLIDQLRLFCRANVSIGAHLAIEFNNLARRMNGLIEEDLEVRIRAVWWDRGKSLEGWLVRILQWQEWKQA